MDPVQRLQRYVTGLYAWLCQVDASARDWPCPAINPPFQVDEAEGFLRAIEGGLVCVAPQPRLSGGMEMTFLSPMSHVKGHFFSTLTKGSGKRGLSRESIAQYAAIADLVFIQGWPVNQIVVESQHWELDFVVYDRERSDPRAQVVIFGEAKSRSDELDRLVAEMTECGGKSPEVHPSPHARTKHNKCLGLLALPRHPDSQLHFWGVAPGKRVAFRVQFDASGSFSLTEDSGIPVGPLAGTEV